MSIELTAERLADIKAHVRNYGVIWRWIDVSAEELLALIVAAEREQRLRAALQTIQQWDCLNPPQKDLCGDLPWLRQLVDAALEDQPGCLRSVPDESHLQS